VIYPLFLPDFNETLIFEKFQISNFIELVHWEPNCVWIDGRTGTWRNL